MPRKIITLIQSLRRRVKPRLTNKPANQFWRKNPLDSPQTVHQKIIENINQREPICIGRVGSVEADIVLWSQNIALPCFPFGKWSSTFFDTEKGLSNAGVKPRTQSSYRHYGQLAYDALMTIDYWAVWCTSYEAVFINESRNSGHKIFISEGEHLAPTMDFVPHWVDALEDKKVLVISPFSDSIQSQIPKIAEIWPGRRWLKETSFTFYTFPYLIDDQCSLNWWDVYEEVAKIIQNTNTYDIALFGCGGLGLPFAALAKQVGKIGVHLGGHLQLLFGIYGNRHLEQEWHRRCINSAWIRPLQHEIAQTAKRVENSCYW